jgi:hypothetical protein
VYGSKIPRIFNVRALEHLSVALWSDRELFTV